MDPADPVVDGLTTAEAAARLARGGPNVLPTAGPRSTWAILFDVVREPMFLLLLVCGALYVVLGDIQDALMLVGFVIVVIVITLIQQRRSERALEALRDLSSPRALVIRDGVRVRIAGRDVVPGDLLVVAEGDRVAADAVLLSGNNVSVDESLLTGESVPVGKQRRRPRLTRAGGDGRGRRRRLAVPVLRDVDGRRIRPRAGARDRRVDGAGEDRRGAGERRRGADAHPEGDRAGRPPPGDDRPGVRAVRRGARSR
jgi:magnesium-transporting ATPase (P-type)